MDRTELGFCANLLVALVSLLAFSAPLFGGPGSGRSDSGPIPSTGDNLVAPTLVADIAAISPGQTFTLGIRMKIEPGWHVYWINPGDAGEPPRAQWKIQSAEDFRFGALLFPVPFRFDLPGGIVSYGYEGEVVLLCEVTAPQMLQSGSVQTIELDLRWLVCSDVCLPGKAKLSIELPVGPIGAPVRKANEELFADSRERLPRDAREIPDLAKLTAKPVRLSDKGAGTGQVELLWKSAAPGSLEWFAPPAESLEFSGTRVERSAERTTVRFAVRSFTEKLAAPVTHESVLAYTDAAGRRRGIRIPIDVTTEAAPDAPPGRD